jgi:hypothetical protein
MLSILIPIFNWNCIPLVKCLYNQARKLKIDFEIVCIDDASSSFKEENRSISDIPFCRYYELTENVGWRKIRNRLGHEAKYEFLLFLDCDAMPTSENYLAIYLAAAKSNTVLSGGCNYPKEKPKFQYLLRYNFGKISEEVDAFRRNKTRYHRFNTFNFLIPKAIFEQVQFDETITRYGHDDTLFGIDLQRLGVNVKHINAPICHTDIDTNEAFLAKSESAIENLFILQSKMSNAIFLSHFQLAKTCERVHIISPFILFIFKIIKKKLRKILINSIPSPHLLSVYKIGYYFEVKASSKK